MTHRVDFYIQLVLVDGGLYVNKVVAFGHRVRHSSGHLWLCRTHGWSLKIRIYIYIFIYI